MKKIDKIVESTFSSVSKLNSENVDAHYEFIKSYKRKVDEMKRETKRRCSIGVFCGDGGCYRWHCCTWKE